MFRDLLQTLQHRVRSIIHENPEMWTSGVLGGLVTGIQQTLKLKRAYACDCLPNRVLGLDAGLFEEFVRFVADRRQERIGLPRQYTAKNPFPWMSETIDLGKEKNFPESHVIDYRKGAALTWDQQEPGETEDGGAGCQWRPAPPASWNDLAFS